MEIDPANMVELANTARGNGTEVIEGNLSYPSETGGSLETSISANTWKHTAAGRW